MERIGYTRLYATVSGAALVLLGLGGLLENARFEYPELTSELLGFYAVNGWANVFHVVVGLIALIMASRLSRLYALIATVLFLGLGIWGVLATDGTLLLSKLPATRAINLVNLLLGLTALACLVAAGWNRIRAFAADRARKRRTGAGWRERRRRRKRIKASSPKKRSRSGPKKNRRPDSKRESKPSSKAGPTSGSGSGSKSDPKPGSKSGS